MKHLHIHFPVFIIRIKNPCAVCEDELPHTRVVASHICHLREKTAVIGNSSLHTLLSHHFLHNAENEGTNVLDLLRRANAFEQDMSISAVRFDVVFGELIRLGKGNGRKFHMLSIH